MTSRPPPRRSGPDLAGVMVTGKVRGYARVTTDLNWFLEALNRAVAPLGLSAWEVTADLGSYQDQRGGHRHYAPTAPRRGAHVLYWDGKLYHDALVWECAERDGKGARLDLVVLDDEEAREAHHAGVEHWTNVDQSAVEVPRCWAYAEEVGCFDPVLQPQFQPPYLQWTPPR